MTKKSKIYLACYSTGKWDDYEEHIVFSSTVKSTVTRWVEKFNKIHERWEEYFDEYYSDEDNWVNDIHLKRWNMLRNINLAYSKGIGRI